MSKHNTTEAKRTAVKAKKRPVDLHVHVKRVMDIFKKRSELAKQAKDFDAKYVLVAADSKSPADVKNPYADALKICDMEIKEVRSTVRSLMGGKNKIFPITLPETNSWNSNGSGVAAGVISCDPSTLAEFTSLAAIFDEYKMVGGEVVYTVHDWIGVIASNSFSMGLLGYDPANITAPTSRMEVAQNQQHTHVPFQSVNGGATITTLTNPHLFKFKYEVPPGVVVGAGATASEGAGSGNWQPTTTSSGYQPYGWMVFYSSGHHASTGVMSGVNYLQCHFRIRE